MSSASITNSPGRGPSGKIRNFKAMSEQKLADAITDLEDYGADTEALNAALAAAGRPPVSATKAAANAKAVQPARVEAVRDDPLGGVSPSKIAMKAAKASSVAQAVAGHDAILEPKLDGHRLLVHRTSDAVHIYAGSGVSKGHLVPHLEKALLKLKPGTWVDGEGVVGKGRRIDGGNDAVHAILGCGSPASNHTDLRFVAFDLITHDGLDIRRVPLSNRRDALAKVIGKIGGPNVALAETYSATQNEHDWLVEQGYEGSIVKWLESAYVLRKRGGGWFKIKFEDFEDVFVIGYEDGKNSFSGMIGAIRFGQIVAGEIVDRGSCSGMDIAMRREITEHQREYMGRVFEIGHKGRYPTGAYRSPQWKRWRPDKLAEDCVDLFQS